MSSHSAIIWALMLRELATRYGRDNLGFLWVVAEPLLFCAAVIALWTAIKPPYEHGVAIIPFVVTGYMPIILVRHMINHALTCVRANTSLLYHRQVTLIHLFVARMTLEFIGVTLAFFTVGATLALFGLMGAPKDLAILYGGWCLLAWLAFGLALMMGAIAEMAPVVERVVAVLTYVLVPLSGTFYMVSWLPPAYRGFVLKLPFIHPIEMIRGGYFGAEVQTFYSVAYAALWAAGFTFVGLLLLRFVRDRVEIE
jgi:capsular polysaccharide transport system permease protein